MMAPARTRQDPRLLRARLLLRRVYRVRFRGVEMPALSGRLFSFLPLNLNHGHAALRFEPLPWLPLIRAIVSPVCFAVKVLATHPYTWVLPLLLTCVLMAAGLAAVVVQSARASKQDAEDVSRMCLVRWRNDCRRWHARNGWCHKGCSHPAVDPRNAPKHSRGCAPLASTFNSWCFRFYRCKR